MKSTGKLEADDSTGPNRGIRLPRFYLPHPIMAGKRPRTFAKSKFQVLFYMLSCHLQVKLRARKSSCEFRNLNFFKHLVK